MISINESVGLWNSCDGIDATRRNSSLNPTNNTPVFGRLFTFFFVKTWDIVAEVGDVESK